MKLERIFKIEPAFDKRNPDPKKNYGIHGCDMIFVVKGEKGAVNFTLFTNWHLPHVTKEHAGRIYDPSGGDYHWMERPMPADLGVHSLTPQYEGHTPIGAGKVIHEAMERNLKKMKEYTEAGKELDFEWEETMKDTGTFTPCEFLDGKPCYYDGSGLAAERYYHILLRKGSEGVWEALERFYKETFNGKT